MVTRFQRYRQIADVLVKYGFGILVEEVIPGGRRLQALRRSPGEERSVYERIRLAIEELGPTYIKFGQIMSTRRELLPPELIEELQVAGPAALLPFEEIRPVIRYCPNLEECLISSRRSWSRLLPAGAPRGDARRLVVASGAAPRESLTSSRPILTCSH